MKSRNIAGLVLIIIGAGFLLSHFAFWNFYDIIGTWYPVLIMAFGLYKISTDKNSIFFGVVVFIVGAVLQAEELDLLPWGFWSTLWPLLLILVGAWMLSRRRKSHSGTHSMDYLDMNFIFSGSDEVIDSANFKGGSLSVLFGGTKVDMRNSTILSDEIDLELSAIFGGIEIFLPANWRVETKGTPIFGALDNKTRFVADSEGNNPLVKIKYTCLFGGIDIKN